MYEGSRGRMIVGFITACAISVYQPERCEIKLRSLRGVLNTIYVIKFACDLQQVNYFKLQLL